MARHTITILPGNIKHHVIPGETIRTALQQTGIFIRSSCGGNGTCGQCKMKPPRPIGRVFSAIIYKEYASRKARKGREGKTKRIKSF